MFKAFPCSCRCRPGSPGGAGRTRPGRPAQHRPAQQGAPGPPGTWAGGGKAPGTRAAREEQASPPFFLIYFQQ